MRLIKIFIVIAAVLVFGYLGIEAMPLVARLIPAASGWLPHIVAAAVCVGGATAVAQWLIDRSVSGSGTSSR